MAMYRCEAKIMGRERRGYSVVAASAYRGGRDMRDERSGRTHYYARRTKGVVATTIVAPEGSPDWVYDPARLWNTVEAGEKRVDAQLARGLILAIPPELSPEAQFETGVGWAQRELVAEGMVVEVSLHHKKNGVNPHLHLLCTMRRIEAAAESIQPRVEGECSLEWITLKEKRRG